MTPTRKSSWSKASGKSTPGHRENGRPARDARGLTAAFPEMTGLTSLITAFAALLPPTRATTPGSCSGSPTRAAGLRDVHSFTRGLDLDIQTATALTMPHHNGRNERVNTKTKMIKWQMYGTPASPCCAIGFILGWGYAPSPPKRRQSH